MLTFADQEGFNTLSRFPDITHDISLCYDQFELSCFRLAGLKDLLEQAHHTLDVELHEVVVVAMLWCFVAEFVDGGRDDCERREQFVGDVRENITHLEMTAQSQAS